MKTLVNRIYNNKNYAKWSKIVVITGSTQVLIQAVGLITGILVIRLLPTSEYALYTLANTMLGTMIVLADGGIATGVTAEAGKVWKEREKLSSVLAAGLRLRRTFSIFSLLLSVPVLMYLLINQGASWPASILIIICLCFGFLAALSDSILEIIPKLHQEIVPLQKNQVQVGLGRLVLSGLSLFVFPWAFIAIISAAIPRIYGNIKLSRITYGFIDISKPNPDAQKNIISIVKKTMPGLIYYCISSQLTIWFLSILGNTTSIAQIGALSRIVMLFSIIGAIFSTILTPRFARLPSHDTQIAKRFIQIVVAFIATCTIFIAATFLFTPAILWVLGPKYQDMGSELILYTIGSCIFTCTGFIYSLTSSRGLILSPYIYITTSIIAIFVGVILFDVSSLIGVLYFNLFVSSIQFIMYSVYSFFTLIKRPKFS